MTRRVFITGRAALTASGESADSTWQAVLKGAQFIEEIKQWNLSSWKYRLGGELKNFQPARVLPDRKLMKVISRQDAIGIGAAVQAVQHSELLGYRETLDCPTTFNERTAVYVGSPGNKYFQQYDFLPLLAKSQGNMKTFAQELFSEVHPMWLLRILPNNVLAYTGITFNFKGINHNITNHAISGTQALIEAYHAIRSGQADRAVVVAYDIGTEPQALFYYQRLGVISANHLKPFDKEHDGTILAEGAAALVLESEASVQARSATCYGEIMAGAAATEAAGLFTLDEEGGALANLLEQTLSSQSIAKHKVACVIAHGNGNKKSDDSEARAIQKVFHGESIPVTAFKWSMGHTLAASGVLDTVLGTYVLQDKCVPGIATLTEIAAECESLSVQKNNTSLSGDKPYAVIINRGYASMNACLVIRANE